VRTPEEIAASANDQFENPKVWPRWWRRKAKQTEDAAKQIVYDLAFWAAREAQPNRRDLLDWVNEHYPVITVPERAYPVHWAEKQNRDILRLALQDLIFQITTEIK